MKFDESLLNQLESGDVNILPVMSIDGSSKLDKLELPSTLPILALRDAVLFPGTVLPITVGRDKSMKLVRALYKTTKIIGTVTQIDIKKEDPVQIDLYEIGTSAKILKLIEMPDGGVTAVLQGIRRFKLNQIIATDPYLLGTVENLIDTVPDKSDKDAEALSDSIKESALYILKMSPQLPQEAEFAIKNIESFEFLVNFISVSLEDQTDRKST